MARCRSTGYAAASPGLVWESVADHVGMSRWAPVRAVELERLGDPPPNGLGAIRVLGIPIGKVREEVTLFDPPGRLGYKLLSGAPVREYRAEVELSPADDGTDISWTASFEPRFPGVQLIVRYVIAALTKGLVAEAERRAGEPAG